MLSRVADCLYWLSRYLERAEHTSRLIDVNLNLMLDQSPAVSGPRWFRLQACLVAAPTGVGGRDPSGTARALAFDLLHRASFASCLAAARENARAIVACLAASRENARQVRESISSEMWEQINRLYLDLRKTDLDAAWDAQPHEFFQAVDRGAHHFRGVTDGTMCHDEGWHFLRAGQFIERAWGLAILLDVICVELLNPTRPESHREDHLEWLGLLRSCVATEAYSRSQSAELRPERIVQFLLLDPTFPHALRFAVDRVGESLAAIAEATQLRNGRAERLAGRLRATLAYAQMDEIFGPGLHPFLTHVCAQLTEIQHAVHQTYVDTGLDAVPAERR